MATLDEYAARAALTVLRGSIARPIGFEFAADPLTTRDL
jgi:hypothetical protein